MKTDSILRSWNGKPVIAYHGSPNGRFDITKGELDRPMFFTSSFDLASDYAASSPRGGAVLRAHLKMSQPLRIDAQGDTWDDCDVIKAIVRKKKATTDDLAQWARKSGYDGVIIDNLLDCAPKGSVNNETCDDEDDVDDSENEESNDCDKSTVYIIFRSEQVSLIETRHNPELASGGTPAFERWFRGSVTRNSDGTPMVLYHWSKSSDPFFVFRTESSKQFGAHFGTKNQAEAVRKRADGVGREYRVYVSIKNPLRLEDPGQWRPKVVLQELNSVPELAGRATWILSKWQSGFYRAMKSTDPTVAHEQNSLLARDRIVKLLKEAGYDGIVYMNRSEGVRNKNDNKLLMPVQIQNKFTFDDEFWPSTSDREFLRAGLVTEDSFIVWNPAQIKLVEGNDGTFDADDPDIRSNPVDVRDLVRGAKRARIAGDAKAAAILEAEARRLEDAL